MFLLFLLYKLVNLGPLDGLIHKHTGNIPGKTDMELIDGYECLLMYSSWNNHSDVPPFPRNKVLFTIFSPQCLLKLLLLGRFVPGLILQGKDMVLLIWGSKGEASLIFSALFLLKRFMFKTANLKILSTLSIHDNLDLRLPKGCETGSVASDVYQFLCCMGRCDLAVLTWLWPGNKLWIQLADCWIFCSACCFCPLWESRGVLDAR